MTPEIGKLLGWTKRLRVTLYVDANGELKCVRVPGTSSAIPKDFTDGLAKHRAELTRMLSSSESKAEAQNVIDAAPCDRQCGDCHRWESMYFGHPPSGNVCRSHDLRSAAA